MDLELFSLALSLLAKTLRCHITFAFRFSFSKLWKIGIVLTLLSGANPAFAIKFSDCAKLLIVQSGADRMATPRLEIRLLGPKDLTDFTKLANYVTMRDADGLNYAGLLAQSLRVNGWSVRGESSLIFGLFAEKSLVGTIALDTRRDEPTNFGFALLPEYWSMGFATEAGRAVLASVLNHPRDFHLPLRAQTAKTNLSALRVLQKLGFVPIPETTKSADSIYFIYHEN